MRETPAQWTVVIRWDRGQAENWRGENGSSLWHRSAPSGWTVALLSYARELVPGDLWNQAGEELIPGVRMLVKSDFPGGTIDADGERLVLRTNAA